MGPYTYGARHVFIRQRKLGRESVTDTKKLRYSSLIFANVQNLRIKNTYFNPYSSDREVQYISLDEPIEIEVLAALGSQPKPTLGSYKEPVKQILCYHIEKKTNMPHQII